LLFVVSELQQKYMGAECAFRSFLRITTNLPNYECRLSLITPAQFLSVDIASAL